MPSSWTLLRPFAVIGGIAVVAGGLVAAVTGPLQLAAGSWLAAYLVLVVGVAQLAFGAGRVWLPDRPGDTAGTILTELLGWNIGSLLVMLGVEITQPLVVAVGSLALVVALVLFLRAVAHPRADRRTWVWVYRLLAVFLAGSVVVGTALAVVRAR